MDQTYTIRTLLALNLLHVYARHFLSNNRRQFYVSR